MSLLTNGRLPFLYLLNTGSPAGQHFEGLVNAIHAPYVPYLLQYGQLEKEYLLQELSCNQMVCSDFH